MLDIETGGQHMKIRIIREHKTDVLELRYDETYGFLLFCNDELILSEQDCNEIYVYMDGPNHDCESC
jgi:hypothetical protein